MDYPCHLASLPKPLSEEASTTSRIRTKLRLRKTAADFEGGTSGVVSSLLALKSVCRALYSALLALPTVHCV